MPKVTESGKIGGAASKTQGEYSEWHDRMQELKLPTAVPMTLSASDIPGGDSQSLL